MLSEPHIFLFGLIYLAVGFAIQNFRRGRRRWGESYFLLPSETRKTQYYPSKTQVFPVKPTGLGNTHKTRVFANLAGRRLLGLLPAGWQETFELVPVSWQET